LLQVDCGGATKYTGPGPSVVGAYNARLGKPTLAASRLGFVGSSAAPSPAVPFVRALANYSYIASSSRGGPGNTAIGRVAKRLSAAASRLGRRSRPLSMAHWPVALHLGLPTFYLPRVRLLHTRGHTGMSHVSGKRTEPTPRIVDNDT
jgi:hypothetical protein